MPVHTNMTGTFYNTCNLTLQSANIYGASASFLAMKTVDYDLQGPANEMLHGSLLL